METSYTTQLALSMLFFAPGIVLFVGLAFVGVLMFLEKTVFAAKADVLVDTKQNIELAAAANPAPGPIVTALKESVKEPAAKQQRKANQ